MGGLRGGDGPEPRVRGAPHVGLLNEIVPSGSPLGAGMDYCLAFSGRASGRDGRRAGGRRAGGPRNGVYPIPSAADGMKPRV